MSKKKKHIEAKGKKISLASLFAKVRQYAKKAIAKQRARQAWNNEHFKNLRLP